ncbi:probable serine carboxypeptidase CPVL [Oscarella lobularis]|uniref:probable serine carboxypeptidase CPVL n=1 Tax=Oscarella lobularis TaxID=121494 RepID=UPI0033137B72
MGLFTLLAALALLFLRFEVDGGMLRRDYGFERLDTEGNVGDRLFLTPYIKSGQTEKARSLSRVQGLLQPDIESYSGFFTTDEKYGSNMFFWFFPAQSGDPNAPVLLWLQGGPGATSLFGLFSEIGPLALTADLKAIHMNVTWNSQYALLFIDNPVGVGFSFTGSQEGYATNEEDVAMGLYSCLTQFFQVFSDYQKNDFYLTGESYAGKYLPAIAYKIHTENPSATVKINLTGISIGDGFCNPGEMVQAYAEYLNQIGLIDSKQALYFAMQADLAASHIKNGDYHTAFDIFDFLMNGDIYPYSTYLANITGGINYDNYLETLAPADMGYYWKYVNLDTTRLAIHVGNQTFDGGVMCEKMLINDVMASNVPWIETVFSSYKTLLYNGQLDIIVAAPLTTRFLGHLEWNGRNAFDVAPRSVWHSGNDVAGYAKTVNVTGQPLFHHVILRNAGHIVPHDQPEWALDMLTRFIEEKPYN